jgi:hypothetical protein
MTPSLRAGFYRSAVDARCGLQLQLFVETPSMLRTATLVHRHSSVSLVVPDRVTVHTRIGRRVVARRQAAAGPRPGRDAAQ